MYISDYFSKLIYILQKNVLVTIKTMEIDILDGFTVDDFFL